MASTSDGSSCKLKKKKEDPFPEDRSKLKHDGSSTCKVKETEDQEDCVNPKSSDLKTASEKSKSLAKSKKYEKTREFLLKEHSDLNQFGLDHLITILRFQLCNEVKKKSKISLELKKTKEVNSNYVKKIIFHLHKRFINCDINLTDKNDQANVRKFLNEIIVPSLSLICELPPDCMWYFILIIHMVLTSKVQFLTEPEVCDLFFCFTHARVPPKTTLPIKEEKKEQIKRKSLEKLQKYGNSDACYFLKKLSDTRSKITSCISNCAKVYWYFLEKILLHDPDCLYDTDVQWLIKDSWPNRIASVHLDNDNKASIIGDCIGMKVLPSQICDHIYKESSSDAIAVTWTNGVVDRFDLKDLIDGSSEVNGPKDFIEILCSLVCQKNKETKEWMLLVDHIKSHRERGAEIYCEDVAYLLEECYKKNEKIATDLFNSIFERIVDDETLECFINGPSLLLMESWPISSLLSSSFVDLLRKASVKFALDFFHRVVKQHDIKSGIEEYWKTVLDFVCVSEGVINQWMSLFLLELKDIAFYSVKTQSRSFFQLIRYFIDENHFICYKNENSFSFLEFIVDTIIKSNIVESSDSINIMEMAISHIESHENVFIPFSSILQMIHCAKGDECGWSENQQKVINLNLALLNCMLKRGLLKSFTNDEEFKENLDYIVSDLEFIVKSCDKAEQEVGLLDGLTTLLSQVGMDQTVQLLMQKRVLTEFLLQNFLKCDSQDQMEFLVVLSIHPDMKEIFLPVVTKLLYLIFDCPEPKNYHNHAKFFDLYAEQILSGSCQFLFDSFNRRKFDLFAGFSHHMSEIRESCIKILLHIVKLEGVNFDGLMEAFPIHPSSEKGSPYNSTFVAKSHPDVDLLGIYYSESLKHKTESWSVTSESLCQAVESLNKDITEGVSSKTLNISGCCSITEDPQLIKLIPNTEPLVETETLLRNVNTIVSVMNNPVNLLLQGPTGVGKTAVITEAARRHGIPLIRCNMSSSTTIANIFGSAIPTETAGTVNVRYQEGPFTTAFSKGAWLLMDEFNLAPDNILSCIENALDTSILFLSTESAELDQDDDSN